MADQVQFSILGLKEVLDKFEGLPKAFKYKGSRFALRKAANLVAEKARENARRLDDPETASVIADNIAVRFASRRFKTTGDVMFRIGVMGGANLKKRDASEGLPGKGTQHWRLLEFGTEKMPAQPFMRPSLEQNINEATNEFVTQMDKWITRNLKRIKKNGI